MKDAIDFLDRIDGHGYGGMADYEVARTTVRDAAAEIERLRAENKAFALAIVKGDEAFDGVGWEGLCRRAEEIANEQRTPEQDAALQELVDQAQQLDMGYGQSAK